MSTPPPVKKPVGRKLLVAAIGVATVSYVVACGGKTDDAEQGTKDDSGVKADAGPDVSSGNLVPPPDDVGPDISSGNLVPPPDVMDDAMDEPDTSTDDALGPDISSGNLVPPPDDADL